MLAERLGYWFLDTGIMYRAVTWLALEQGVSPDDGDGLGSLAGSVRLRPVSMQGEAVEVSGTRVGPELRESRVDSNVSNVSRHPAVREALVEQQRDYAGSVTGSQNGMDQTESGRGIVMIGRDIGTVVLPDAGLKVYLTASRQGARVSPLSRDAGPGAGGRARESAWGDRGARRHRLRPGHSPLRPADDAWELDTTCLGIDEVVAAILQRVNDAR